MKQIRLGFDAPWIDVLLGHSAPNRSRKLALTVLLASTVLAIASAQRAWQVNSANQALAEQTSSIQAKGMPLPLSQVRPDNETTAKAQAVLRAMNRPWMRFFNVIESKTSPAIALLNLEPDLKSGFIKITAEAKQLKSLLEYSDQLSSTPPFTPGSLEHHEIFESDPNKPVRLTFQLRLMNDWLIPNQRSQNGH